MIIPIAGMDPSLTHWGIAEANLDLRDGFLVGEPELTIIEPEEITTKQVRTNSKDLYRAEQLAKTAYDIAQRCKVIFVEMPVGSQSANGMKAYGVCVGIVGMIRSLGVSVIEVQALDVKKALSGNRNASKKQMIEAAVNLYPHANWPRYTRKGVEQIPDKAEHAADALGAIHAGVVTPEFQQLRRLFEKVA